uniref:Tetraspanin-4 n=1 Tax=Oncorhynchus kisutch TaxID=8019 RepID=A0A8C7GK74_ONCKI
MWSKTTMGQQEEDNERECKRLFFSTLDAVLGEMSARFNKQNRQLVEALCALHPENESFMDVEKLGGCGILGVGVWLSVTQGNFATLSSSLPSLSAANLLIVVGTIIMVIGCLGCVGAVKESRPLLLSFFILLLLIFFLEILSITLFFVYQDQIDHYARRDLKRGLQLFGTEGNVGLTNAWMIVQTDFRCCGVTNHTDWFDVYNASRVPDSCCLEYSDNCGLENPGTWWTAPCYERVKDWLQENLVALWIFALCTALTQILGLVFSMTMFCHAVKVETFYA